MEIEFIKGKIMQIMAINPSNYNNKTFNNSKSNNKIAFGMNLVYIPNKKISTEAAANIRKAINDLRDLIAGKYGTIESRFDEITKSDKKTLYGLIKECDKEIPRFETKPVGVRAIAKGRENIKIQVGNISAKMPKSILLNPFELAEKIGSQLFLFASNEFKKQPRVIEASKPKLFPPYGGV